MKDSSARQGALKLSPEEKQAVLSLKRAAEEEVCWDGDGPKEGHRTTIGQIHVAFFLSADREGDFGQFQLDLASDAGTLGLDKVQAMASLFFEDRPFQIMPNEYNPAKVRVTGLFFPYSES